MSRDPDDEYFSDGLAEEIMNTLAHLPGLKVTARTSAFAFRGKEQDIRRIAEALNVRTILEGSVRRSGSRIRVTAQLINADDGYHLWSERYDREMADVFAMQDEIAAAIATALEVKLRGKPPSRQHLPDLRAYETFLKARHELLKIDPESAGRAKQLLEQAIALDPAYSEPYAELGSYYFLQVLLGLRSAGEAVPAARAQAQMAIQRSASDARAHGVLCSVAGVYDYDWKEAGDQFRLALAAEPVPSEVRARCAMNYLLPLHRLEEAMEQFEKALEHDPLNAFVRGAFALVLGIAEMHDRALIEAKKATEVDANLWLPHFAIAFSYAHIGKLDDARAPAERSVRAAPWQAQAVGLLAGILARLGETRRADELVRKLSDMPPIGRLHYHLLNSADDTTVDWYSTMVQSRDPYAAAWSSLKPLRTNPRWPALAKMMNLPAAES